MMQRKKITEIQIPYKRTIEKRDKTGKRFRETVDAIKLRQVEIVSPGIRFVHYLIDGTLMYFLWFGLNVVGLDFNIFSSSFHFYMGSDHVYISFDFLFLSLIYYPFFEGLFQVTPGKVLTRSTVINEYAEKPGFDKIFIRSLVRLVPFEGLSCFAGLGWHDKWSETWVVKKEEMEKLQELLRQNP